MLVNWFLKIQKIKVIEQSFKSQILTWIYYHTFFKIMFAVRKRRGRRPKPKVEKISVFNDQEKHTAIKNKDEGKILS